MALQGSYACLLGPSSFGKSPMTALHSILKAFSGIDCPAADVEVRVCVRVCAHPCMCVRACLCLYVCVRVCVCVHTSGGLDV
jgi:hypothetical protein